VLSIAPFSLTSRASHLSLYGFLPVIPGEKNRHTSTQRRRELERFAGRRAQVEYIHARGVYAEYGDMENMSLQNGENPSVTHKKCKILVLKISILLYTFPSEHLQRSREPRPPHSVYRSPAQDV